MYLQAGHPVRAFRPFGDFEDEIFSETPGFDWIGNVLEPLGKAALSVGVGVGTNLLNQTLRPGGTAQPIYAPYNAQPGTAPPINAAVATANPVSPAGASASKAQDLTPPWLIGAAAVVLLVLVLK